MEMDYDLLEIDSSITNSSLPTAEVAVESTPISTPVEEQTPQLPTDDFDDSVPLTPREKLLMDRLDRITGENLALSAPPTTTRPVPQALSDRNFLDGLDIDEVLATPDNLNKLLLSVYNSAMEESSKLSAERILQDLPQIMSTHMSMAKMAEKFYTDNADLASSSQTVASVANKIAAEHPEYTAEQVFDASAIEARKILRIKAVNDSSGLAKPATKPAFVGPSRGRSSVKAPVMSDIQKGVLDLISD